MFRLFIVLIISIMLFAGCSSKEETALLKVYKEKIDYHKNLQQTEKALLYEGNTSMVIVTASYQFIETAEKNDTRPEVFIVAVQFNDADAQHIDFKASDSRDAFSLTLEGMAAIKVKALTKEDKALKKVSFVTPWGQYYEVTYPHTNKKQFELYLESKMYGSEKLSFSKVAKFVYTKEGF